MKIIIKIFLLIALSLVVNSVLAKDLILAGCLVLDESGVVIKRIPAMFCHLADNGSRVEIKVKSITYFDERDNVLWSHKGIFHHQFKIDDTKKNIVVLSHSTHMIMGCLTKFDVIKKYDLKTGQLIKEVDFFDMFNNEKMFFNINENFIKKAYNFKSILHNQCDTTHLNSIFQITENSLSKKDPTFNSGNWLINFAWGGLVVIMDKNLDKVLWKKHIEFNSYNNFHDIQLTENGKILLYANKYYGDDLHPNNAITVVIEVDPMLNGKESIKIIELKNDGKPFVQRVMGGIQYLKDGKKLASVFNDVDGYQLIFYNKNWEQINKITPNPTNGPAGGFQEAKVIDLSSFLKNYKGQL